MYIKYKYYIAFYLFIINFFLKVIPASDNRYYVVRYTSSHNSPNTRYKYYNATDLNCMIDDLKPNTQYEFTVKVVKV